MTPKRSAQIVALLEAEDRELRWAAAKVLGAVGGDEAAVAALCRTLHTEDPRLRLAALQSITAIGKGDAFPDVAPLLEEPGDVGHAAMECLAGYGAKVLTKLKGRFDGAGEVGRRRMLTLAARLRGAQGIGLIVRALENGHADEVAALGERLASELEAATARERGVVVAKLDAFLAQRGQGSDPGAVGAAIELLTRLAGAKAQGRLLEYSRAGNPPRVRRRALEALARVAPGVHLDAELTEHLLGLLKDRDFTNVAAPAMSVLERAKLDESHLKPLLHCLSSDDPGLRRFAVGALGQVDSPKAVNALIKALLSDNPDLQRRAADSLSRQGGAVAPLIKALSDAPDPKVAWVLARILAPRVHLLTKDHAAQLSDATARWLEPGDPRAAPALTILRERFLPVLEEACLKRVQRIRRHRVPGEIINLLTPVCKDGVPSPRSRYECALAEIMRGPKDVVREIRLENVGLQQFESLAADAEFGLANRLKRDKSIVTAEEYYLIGSHFAERSYGDKAFGGDLLRWLVQNFPDEPAARAAEYKLTMEGFPPPPKPKPKRTPARPKPAAPKPKPAAKTAKKAKQAVAKKSVAKKVAKKAVAKKAKKAVAKKAVAKKTARIGAKKTPAKKTAKAPVRKPAKKAAKKASRSGTASRKKTAKKKPKRSR